MARPTLSSVKIALASLLLLNEPARAAEASTGLRLLLENPHYLLFRGKPTLLIGSGEHYGAVLNLDFDSKPYLDRLRADGLNLTRLFSGLYCESEESFGIEHNTLAPLKGKLICPFARSDQPGYANGGNKFDLKKWDEVYFKRLRAFVDDAAAHGVVVEFSPFCPFYDDQQWALSPLNAKNNISGIGDLPRTDVYTLKNKLMLELHERIVRKFVDELKNAGNVYFEICNEPYFGGVAAEWQNHIADVIVDAEKDFPPGSHHLIAQNIANETAKITKPHPEVSIFNFHYAAKSAASDNVDLNKPLGDDETGFKPGGGGDAPYRIEAWEFVMSGGAIFDNLDYSFAAGGHEDGSYLHTKSPGGGGPGIRGQLHTLKSFIESFDLSHLRPDSKLIPDGIAGDSKVLVLSSPGHFYAIYLRGGTKALFTVDLPAGQYRAQWINPATGESTDGPTYRGAGGKLKLESPKYDQDIALRLERTSD